MGTKPTKEQFLELVSKHKMTIENDNGIFRTLAFSDGTFNQAFRITTWTGYLCLSGDMGTFVFARTEDMFRFFRHDEINPRYWSEKIQAAGNDDNPVMEFCAETLIRDINDHIEDYDIGIKERIEKDIICHLKFGVDEFEAIQLLSEDDNLGQDYLCDLSRWNYRDFTYRYIWVCYAIVWAIQQYDEHKGET